MEKLDAQEFYDQAGLGDLYRQEMEKSRQNSLPEESRFMTNDEYMEPQNNNDPVCKSITYDGYKIDFNTWDEESRQVYTMARQCGKDIIIIK